MNYKTNYDKIFIKTHILVNACFFFSKRPFYVCYMTYVTLNMHYSIYMFTMRFTHVKYVFKNARFTYIALLLCS